tara:strand:+ start:169 stop:333 length:165 start_codon:yes stop_codon:yes gene_type:complete
MSPNGDVPVIAAVDVLMLIQLGSAGSIEYAHQSQLLVGVTLMAPLEGIERLAVV